MMSGRHGARERGARRRTGLGHDPAQGVHRQGWTLLRFRRMAPVGGDLDWRRVAAVPRAQVRRSSPTVLARLRAGGRR